MLVSVCRLQWIQTSLNTVQFCYRSIQQSTITVKYPCAWAANRTMRFRYAALRQRPAPSRGRASSFPVHSCLLLSDCQKCSRQSLMLRLPAAPECPIFLCMFRALFRRTVFIKSSKAYCLSAFDLLSFHIPLICASIYQLQNETSTFPKIRAKRKNFL